MSDDVDRLRQGLHDVARRAKDLPWAKERRWRPGTHVRWEGELATVDLHDLSVRLGLAAVDVVETLGPDLATGAVRIVTGRGNHTGGRSVLKDGVVKELRAASSAAGWGLRQPTAGSLVVVFDASRAPAAASGQLGGLFWGFALILGGAILLIAPWMRVVALVAAAAWAARWLTRRIRRP